MLEGDPQKALDGTTYGGSFHDALFCASSFFSDLQVPENWFGQLIKGMRFLSACIVKVWTSVWS